MLTHEESDESLRISKEFNEKEDSNANFLQ
jgi:hypothetical protein